MQKFMLFHRERIFQQIDKATRCAPSAAPGAKTSAGREADRAPAPLLDVPLRVRRRETKRLVKSYTVNDLNFVSVSNMQDKRFSKALG
eukprot:scaffold4826_cov188-Prasinococcus_capsulatus_cf.AAC.1